MRRGCAALSRTACPPRAGAVYSFSGGVADLMEDRPRAPFAYGDLGVLLGRAVAKSAVGPRIPARETIRATVIGAGWPRHGAFRQHGLF